MTDVKPVLNQLNIVAKDFDATIEFYRRLGVDVNLVGDAESSNGIRHAEATLPNGFVLEFDNPVLARTYNASWAEKRGQQPRTDRVLSADTRGRRSALCRPPCRRICGPTAAL